MWPLLLSSLYGWGSTYASFGTCLMSSMRREKSPVFLASSAASCRAFFSGAGVMGISFVKILLNMTFDNLAITLVLSILFICFTMPLCIKLIILRN